MRRPGKFRVLSYCAILMGLLGYSMAANAHRSLPMSGRVIDTDGQPVELMSVSVITFGDHGPKTITVYTDKTGTFATPSPVALNNFVKPPVVARKIGYEQVGRSSEFLGDYESVFVTLTVTPVLNQVAMAPASAWLAKLGEERRIRLIRQCAGCHQMPAPAVRNYARLIEAAAAKVEGTDIKQAGIQSWDMIQRYMHALSAENVVQNIPHRPPTTPTAEADNSPVERVDSQLSETLAEHFVGPMDHLASYSHDAPLLATSQTMILGYLTQSSNTGSEALLLGTPPRLWVSAGGASETMIAIDLETGQPGTRELPINGPLSEMPHKLQRDAVGNLWITPHMNNIVGLYDPDNESWIRTWTLEGDADNPISINSLAFGHEHQVMADNQGRIWFFDHGSHSFGSFSPATGDSELVPVPRVAGQKPVRNAESGDLVISSDGKQVWFSQVHTGRLISISTETHELTIVPLPGELSAPGQIAISDEDVLFVPLFETGQLFEYNTRTDTQTIHDLPDRASAPQAATFDPARRVIWITTANGDLIYRFDLRTREFAVLPLAQQATRLRTITVDPVSNMLIAGYADAGAKIPGPGMVVTIDPGDGLVPVRTNDQATDDADAN